jgi:menaquinone-9 beta-reductase
MVATDVVVVGGGIAGAALARSLAEGGVRVTVLEASERFEDRVRGEQMHIWGVLEARAIGAEQVLLDAGAHIAPLLRQYVEGNPEPIDVPSSLMLPGVSGMLNLRHPDACQALLDAAGAAGASVVRGARDVTLTRGRPATVAFGHEGRRQEVSTGLVIGADGRSSTVRRQAGIELEKQPAVDYTAGLLLEGLDGVPDDHDVMVAEGDDLFALFHQGHGRARAYLMFGSSGQHRFAGRDAVGRFLDSLSFASYPLSDRLAAATPAGPCATYPGDDTWTATPYAEGVVLVGDAAGYNDPIIGEGLSIAMRDARSVRDLVLGGARAPQDFAPYGEEREERMRCLRLIADVMSVVHLEDGGDRRARRRWFGERMAGMDPEIFPLVAAAFTGPEKAPAELVDERILDRIRAAPAVP